MKTNESKLKNLTGYDFQLNWQIEHKKEEIVDKAKWLRGQLDELIEKLSADGRLSNSLGVLQGNGPDLDRMIGEYATLLQVKTNLASWNEEARS